MTEKTQTSEVISELREPWQGQACLGKLSLLVAEAWWGPDGTSDTFLERGGAREALAAKSACARRVFEGVVSPSACRWRSLSASAVSPPYPQSYHTRKVGFKPRNEEQN
ncbi:hypothetical protein FOCC_FOCC003383 [Frankliniella occidentalis]|nr:hypothetical protein FOCC_FOCC003383 [Frankliniella occidentalis]